MKCFLIILITSISMWAVEVHRMRYLVENQRAPYTLKLSFNTLTKEMNKLNISLDGNPIPIVLKKSMIFTLGGGLIYERIPVKSDKDAFVSNVVTGAFVSVFTSGSIAKNWYWLGFSSYGSFADHITSAGMKSDNFSQSLLIGRKFNDNLSIGLGAFLSTNYGNFLIFPVPLLAYSIKAWCFTVGQPGQVEIRFLASDKVEFFVGVRKYDYASYSEKAKDILLTSGYDMTIGVDVKLGKFVVFQLGGGSILSNKMKLRQTKELIGQKSGPIVECNVFLIVE